MDRYLESITNQFPDWRTIEKGNWSAHSLLFWYTEEDCIELGLYREPDSEGEIAGTYTLQGFDGDDVVICHTVVGLKGD